MVLAARLAQILSGKALRYSYRFIWIPGTIGAITWLALNEGCLPSIKHGLVLSCLGDPGRFTYKRSRRQMAEIDRVVSHLLQGSGRDFDLVDFSPSGYDERQYCSPGINLPVGCLMRTPNGKYPQYHTSADDLSFVSASALGESMQCILRIIHLLERNCRYSNQNPKCEPQLGRRGLYRQVGGIAGNQSEEAILWVLNLSDGDHTLLDIAERSKIDFDVVSEAARVLAECGLLQRLASCAEKLPENELQ
jgi:aminopeptidase-like protein